MTRIDMLGGRFGRLLVIGRAENDCRGEARWVCLCECGNESVVLGSHLRSGRVRSCGCYAREISRKQSRSNLKCGNLKHGGVGTRLYRIWANMKTRCFNSNSPMYQWYGAVGVTVCEDWMNFANFRKWALSSGYEDSLTIERINPFGNYDPQNCTWIPLREQNKNKRCHPTYETHK